MNSLQHIVVHDLEISYPERSFSLTVDQLEISKGEMTILLGSTGTGKSTLLDVLGLIEKPSMSRCAISYHLNDLPPHTFQNLWSNARKRNRLKRQRFGYMFQQAFFIPDLTVRKNINVSQVLSGGVSAEKANQQGLSKNGLFRENEQFSGHELAWQCSGGQQQRLALTRALIHQPELLFLDEPTGDLDRNTAQLVFEHLKREVFHAENANRSIVMVTHDMALACQYGDSIYFIDKEQSRVGLHTNLRKRGGAWYYGGKAMDTEEAVSFLLTQM